MNAKTNFKGHRKGRPITASILTTMMVILATLSVAGPAPAITSDPYVFSHSTVPGAGDLYDVGVLSAKDIYAVGNDGAGNGKVFHFDGTVWSSVATLPSNAWSVHALDATHIWAVGSWGEIFFFDGTTWENQSVGSDDLFSVYALDASHVWAVGRSGVIRFYNGHSWSSQTVGSDSYNSVQAVDPTHVWAVGTNGRISFFDGTTWHNQSIGTVTHTLNGVWAADANYAYAFGKNSTEMRYRGTAWTGESHGTDYNYNGVFALSPERYFVTTSIGHIQATDGSGGAWYDIPTGTAEQLWGIDALDPGHVYAVGTAGAFIEGHASGYSAANCFEFAEGTCRPGFDTYFCIQNPNSVAADVRINYALGSGDGRMQLLSVPPSSRTTVVVKDFLGTGDDPAHDFCAEISSTNDAPIIAERPMYFNYHNSKGEYITGGHDVVGLTRNTSRIFYFAEGTCRPGFDPYICLGNIAMDPVQVRVTYMLGDGTTREQEVTVGPTTRKTIVVKDILGSADDEAHDFSTLVQVVTPDRHICAERPIYFSYQGSAGVYTGGHDIIGASAPSRSAYFAEGTCRPGFDPYLCIQNPGDNDANVKITYMLGSGGTSEQEVVVGRISRSTVNIRDHLGTGDDPAHDFSVVLNTTNGTNILAERPMYFKYNGPAGSGITGGHDVVGLSYAATYFYFAEGTCRPAFDPYLCVQNPRNWSANVRVTYMRGDATSTTRDLTVEPRSRVTVPVKDILGSGEDPSHDFSIKIEGLSNASVVCERPMYFNYHGIIDGGHDVMGYVP